jgi:hypothetical protein
MNAWSHLPNACHIDRVIKSVNSHPKIWGAARDAAHNEDWYAAYVAAYGAAWIAAQGAAWIVARDAAYVAAQAAAYVAAQDAARFAARDAIAALIAYDDASKYLDMPSDHLRFWAILSEEPAAVLLLPAVIAFERINVLECV